MQNAVRQFFFFGILTFLFLLVPQAQAQTGDGCGTASTLTDEQRASVANKATAMSSTPDAYACRNVSGLSRTERNRACVSGLCNQYPSTAVLCCPGNLGQAPGTASAPVSDPTGPGTTGQSGGVGRLALPACVSDGDCDLDDLVTMAVNFSNFLFGISGAIFLLVFVVAGFRLIFFAHEAKEISTAKDALVKASIGMGIIALAGVLTTFLYNNLRGRSNSGTEGRGNTCAEEVPASATSPAFECQLIEGIPSKSDYDAYSSALNSLGCRPSNDDTTNLCPRAKQYCCPPGVTNNYIPPASP